MGKYKYAVKKELAWLSEDYRIAHEMIDRIDKGEQVGWTREYLMQKGDFASRARKRLQFFIHEYKECKEN